MNLKEFDELIELVNDMNVSLNKSNLYFIEEKSKKIEIKLSRLINGKNKEKLVLILDTLKEVTSQLIQANNSETVDFDYYLGIYLNLKDELELI